MFTFYEVGGKVRDEFLGVKSKDIDFVAVPNPDRLPKDTNINDIFDMLCLYLKIKGYEIFITHPDMYTIRAKFPRDHKNAGITADFVIARKEIGYETGTRKPILVAGTLDDDLARRDFTVNAIAKAEDGTYYDPYDGATDIRNGILRTPISGYITFADDPLRILRAIRFSITKGFLISHEIDQIIENFDYEKYFDCISEERIREELYKCFKHNTLETLCTLEKYRDLQVYVFMKTKLWLKPTNEQ